MIPHRCGFSQEKVAAAFDPIGMYNLVERGKVQ